VVGFIDVGIEVPGEKKNPDLSQVTFSPGTPFSFTNITDHHEITEILLKVALNTNKYIVAVSFIGGGNRSIRRKPSTCRIGYMKGVYNISYNSSTNS
jgi:hypothetical protein